MALGAVGEYRVFVMAFRRMGAAILPSVSPVLAFHGLNTLVKSRWHLARRSHPSYRFRRSRRSTRRKSRRPHRPSHGGNSRINRSQGKRRMKTRAKWAEYGHRTARIAAEGCCGFIALCILWLSSPHSTMHPPAFNAAAVSSLPQSPRPTADSHFPPPTSFWGVVDG